MDVPGKVKSGKNPRNKTGEKHFIAIFIFSLKLNTQKKICVAPEFKMKNLNWNALKFSEKNRQLFAAMHRNIDTSIFFIPCRNFRCKMKECAPC